MPILGLFTNRCALSAAVVLCLVACAQAPKPSGGKVRGAEYYELLQRVQDLKKQEKLADAVPLAERLVKSYPDDCEIWMQLGAAYAAAKQYNAAAEAYTQAVSRGGEYPGSYAYRIAVLYAWAGDKTKAFEWISKALATPFERRPQIGTDEIFESWREDGSFRKLAGLAPKTQMSREEGWNYDLDFLVAEIHRMHYSYRNGSLPPGFAEDLREVRQRISKLSDSAMGPQVQRLLARLGDGHTGLRAGPPRQIPFVFYAFSDGIFVIDAPQDCECIGARLTAIGSKPIDDAVRAITPFLSVDNAMGVRLQAPTYLRFVEYLLAAAIIPSEEQVVLSLEGPGGVKRQVTARPTGYPNPRRKLFPPALAHGAPVPLYLQRVGDNYWFQVLPDDKTMYFQFNQVLDASGETLEQFAARFHHALLSTKLRNLIIDLRHNSGGNLNLFPPLLRTIITFQTMHEGAGLYVITGRQTFSAAQVFLNDLDRYTSAIVAGEPSGSRPNFVGESAAAMLPISGLQMTISTRYHQTEDQDQRVWIAPKIPVELSSADYFSNRDPVLDAVLQVIHGR